MLQRLILSTGESVPVIGIGSWLRFDIGESSSKRNELKQVLALMHQHKASVIDSSPMYGRSEQVIGELTDETGLANEFFYATKVWTSGRQAGIKQMNESMQRMRRSTMDLIQVHNLVDWQTHLGTLQEWKKEGRIRYTGITHYQVSFHSQLAKIIEQGAVDFVQFNYSIATRHAEKNLLPLAMEKGVAVIINEPLEKGALFQKVKSKPIPSWAADYEIKSWASFFLKYIISHPAVTCVIPATGNPLHMRDNLLSGEDPLPDEKGRKKMADYFDTL
ncbi:MAG: aldo/keto reductase [Bacteroidetes bacterium]|nr:MAG: aldo/keto reductase [Bacteroidota bacterium]